MAAFQEALPPQYLRVSELQNVERLISTASQIKTMSEEALHVIESAHCINEAVLSPVNNDTGRCY